MKEGEVPSTPPISLLGARNMKRHEDEARTLRIKLTFDIGYKQQKGTLFPLKNGGSGGGRLTLELYEIEIDEWVEFGQFWVYLLPKKGRKSLRRDQLRRFQSFAGRKLYERKDFYRAFQTHFRKCASELGFIGRKNYC